MGVPKGAGRNSHITGKWRIAGKGKDDHHPRRKIRHRGDLARRRGGLRDDGPLSYKTSVIAEGGGQTHRNTKVEGIPILPRMYFLRGRA